MRLRESNLYISRHGGGYCVNIDMPNGTRNFLHNEPVKNLVDAMIIMDSLSGDVEINHSQTSIIEDDTYFKIRVKLEDGQGKEQIFHSRKLNLNDVISEFNLVVGYNELDD